jgi:hypothetical protein
MQFYYTIFEVFSIEVLQNSRAREAQSGAAPLNGGTARPFTSRGYLEQNRRQ